MNTVNEVCFQSLGRKVLTFRVLLAFKDREFAIHQLEGCYGNKYASKRFPRVIY